MSELNRDQIVKALDCCFVNSNCNGCPLYRKTDDCLPLVGVSAIALIKELTAKVAKWEEECDLRGDMWCKLNEENKKLTEENERLIVTLKMNDAPFPEGLQIVHDFCEKGKRKAKADTVRKMQERLKERKVSYGNISFRVVPIDDIDQIAKEMLEVE